MNKLKDYKISFDYKSNALEIVTPDGYCFFCHNCGLDDEGVKKSIKNIKFYPEHEMKNLLDRGIDFKTAFAKISGKQNALNELQTVAGVI